MANPKYKAYLLSKEWKAKREKILTRDKFKCRYCSSKKNLHVHHLTYKRIYKEKPSDLITACKRCHNRLHGRYTFKEKAIIALAKTAFSLVLLGTIIAIYWRIK